jgi:hypothetical protein
MGINTDQIKLFTSLFQGRRDVFAKRWETKDKNIDAMQWIGTTTGGGWLQ